MARARDRTRHQRAVAAEVDGEALAQGARHLVRGRAHRTLHYFRVARLRMIGVVPVREQGQVGEVHHARAARAQVREEAGLAQREGAALQAGSAAAGRAGHSEDRDLAGGHQRSIIMPFPAALPRDFR